MAYENADEFVTLPATTGLVQYQFVTVNTSGKAARPTAGGRVLGVLVSSGTNGSTEDRYATIQISGIAKVTAPASTLAVGDTVSATTLGYAKPSTGTQYVIGLVVDGSSGGAGRILSVSLTR